MRSTMTNLINILRGMTDAGSADYTIASKTYWTDDEMQNVLDRYRTDIYREHLSPIQSMTGGGTIAYYNHQSQFVNFEETVGGTAIFEVETSNGDNVGTASFTTDYYRGLVTFAANTAGTAYYLTGRSYELNMAAADVWRQKAGHAAASFNFSTDNHKLDKGQLINNALKMAQYYGSLASPITCTMTRSDLDSEALKVF